MKFCAYIGVISGLVGSVANLVGKNWLALIWSVAATLWALNTVCLENELFEP